MGVRHGRVRVDTHFGGIDLAPRVDCLGSHGEGFSFLSDFFGRLRLVPRSEREE